MQPGLTRQKDRQTNLETERAFSAVASVSGLHPPSQPHHCLINPTTGNIKPFTAQLTVLALCLHNAGIIQIISDGIKHNFCWNFKSWHRFRPDEKYMATQSCTRGHPSRAYLCGLVAITNYCCLSCALMTWENKVVKKKKKAIALWR